MKKMIAFLSILTLGFWGGGLSWAQQGTPRMNADQRVRQLYELGTQALNKQDFKKAEEYFNKLIELKQDFAPAYSGMGMALKGQNYSISEVAWYFKTAVELDPKYADGYENLAKAYYELHQYENAQNACLKALAIDPKHAGARLTMGWVLLLGLEQPAEAIPYFKQIIEETKFANAYFGLGLAYLSSGQRPLALEIITMLKGMKEEKLAAQLEDMLRQTDASRSQPSQNQAGALPAPNQPANPSAAQPYAVQPASATATLNGTGVMKVRLRGKLVNTNAEQEKKKP